MYGISWGIFIVVAVVIGVAVISEISRQGKAKQGIPVEPEESLEELMTKGVPPTSKTEKHRTDASRLTKYIVEKEQEKVEEINGGE